MSRGYSPLRLAGMTFVMASVSLTMSFVIAGSRTAQADQAVDTEEHAEVAEPKAPTVRAVRLRDYHRAGPGALLGGETLVYSNTGSDTFFPPGPDRRIADDMFLTELCGCRLTRYQLTVGGGGTGSGDPFSVEIGLYDGCPNNGGQLIPGAASVFNAPDDDTYVVEVDLGGEFVEVPAAVWLAVEFDRANAGWFVGEVPELGFSDDVYDFPGFDCVAQVAGDFYASFAAQVFCNPPGAPQVSNELPPSGTIGVSTNVTLAWNGGVPPSPLAATEEQIIRAPESTEDGTVHPDEFLKQLDEWVANGELPITGWENAPPPEPRTYFGPTSNVAGFEVPTVTTADIFLYEDTDELLISNFSGGQYVGLMADAANQVIAEHGDNFDFIGFWTAFQPHHTIGAAVYHFVFNDVSGIGSSTFNNRNSMGINTNELQGFVTMWDEDDWSEGYFTFTQLVLGQEFQHRFAMFLNDIPDGRPLQGNNGSCGRSGHWNFRVDGQGSGMEIAEWIGSNPAIRKGGTLNFNSDIDSSVFSYPDLYLMGYVPGSELDTAPSELRYMDNNNNCSNSYNGPISTWGHADIVAGNGNRNPSFVQAQKHFSTAWVMFHLPGQEPSNSQLTHVTSILNTWNDVYLTSVLGRGTMSNVLNPTEPQLCSVAFDVLIDTNNPPTTPACQGISEKICDPGPLDQDETYFWRVVATNDMGTTQGPVWSFDTLSAADDCNNNGVHDATDISTGVSEDCNSNSQPDECEPDNDGDNVPNACDVCPGGDDTVDTDSDGVPNDCDACPLDNPDDQDGDGVCTSDDNCILHNPEQLDCQPNGVGDVCDLAGGTSDDVNLNDIPDECDGGTPSQPLGEDSLAQSCKDDAGCANEAVCREGLCYSPKSRYISVTANPSNGSLLTARRVQLETKTTPALMGWVGEPVEVNVEGEPGVLLVSQLEPTPFYADWTAYKSDTIHIGDCQIGTGQSYMVTSIFNGVDVGNESNYSAALALPTVLNWGDVVGNDGTSPSDGFRTFVDIQAVVLGFQNNQLVSKIHLELDGAGIPLNIPDVSAVNFTDILRAVEGFQGGSYPFSDPLLCP